MEAISERKKKRMRGGYRGGQRISARCGQVFFRNKTFFKELGTSLKKKDQSTREKNSGKKVQNSLSSRLRGVGRQSPLADPPFGRTWAEITIYCLSKKSCSI